MFSVALIHVEARRRVLTVNLGFFIAFFIFKTSNEFPHSVNALDKVIDFDFGGLEHVLEGKFRPGHFQGMANVVSLLLQIAIPNKAYFGLKDFQQFRIVTKLVEILKMDVEIVGCPIIREENGLARSSRNERLSKPGRESASVISYSLNYIKTYHSNFSVKEIQEKAKGMIHGILEVEYLEI